VGVKYPTFRASVPLPPRGDYLDFGPPPGFRVPDLVVSGEYVLSEYEPVDLEEVARETAEAIEDVRKRSAAAASAKRRALAESVKGVPRREEDPLAVLPNLTEEQVGVLRQAARDQLAIDDLSEFVKQAWDIVEPGVPMVHNWHVDVLARELQVVYPGVRSIEPPFGWAVDEDGVPTGEPVGGMWVSQVDEPWREYLPLEVRPPPLWRNSRLVINIPPGHMKSLMVSVFWPAWIWLRDPGHRLLSIAGADTLAIRDAMRTRTIIDTAWYQRLKKRVQANLKREAGRLASSVTCPAQGPRGPLQSEVRAAIMGAYASSRRGAEEVWSVDSKKDAKASFGTTLGGYRESRAIGSRITGERGYGWTLDDPIDVKEVLEHGQVDHERVSQRCQEVNDKIDKALMSRLNDKRPGRHYCVIIMQRLHIDDPAGHNFRKGWRTVALRSRYIPDEELDEESVPNHPDDPRHRAHSAETSQTGAPLFARMYPGIVLSEIELNELGHEQFNAQHQQNPLPGKGGTLNEALDRANRYIADPFLVAAGTAGLRVDGKPVGRLNLTLAVDATFGSKGATASNVALEVWGSPFAGHCSAHDFLLDCHAERMTYTETEEAILAMLRKWPSIRVVLIEEKANGAALLNRLRNRVRGLLPFDPKGSKQVRAAVWASVMRQGLVWLPAGDPRRKDAPENPHTPWIRDFVTEVTRFPGGRRDDRVDAASSYAIYRTENKTAVDPKDRQRAMAAAMQSLAKQAAAGFWDI